MVLIQFASRFLALTEDQFKEALARGQEIMGGELVNSKSEQTEKLVDAEGANKLTSIPASWFLEAARQGKIPHIKAGKYVRFRMEEVIKTLETRTGHKARRNFSRK